MSSVTVKIPTPVRPLTAGQSEVKIEGATVREVLQKMDSQFKGFGDRVLDDGETVKRFINVFVNEDNIRDKKELDTELKNGDTISILPSIAGGKFRRGLNGFNGWGHQRSLDAPSVESVQSAAKIPFKSRISRSKSPFEI